MIKVDKTSIAIPKKWLKDGKREKVAVINYYFNSITRKPRKRKKPFKKYKVYNDEIIKEILKSVFFGKCAYCESKIDHDQPGDVEHFRPKSQVQTRDGKIIKTGYYWLAADWENLLYSCDFCNRGRKHLIPGETKKRLLGKQDKFPLEDETLRCKHYGERISKEERARLLIHPCKDQPQEHLIFSQDGNVRARMMKSGTPSIMGHETIEICGLHRMSLVHKRAAYFSRAIQKEFLEFDGIINSIKQLKLTPSSSPGFVAALATLQSLADSKINHLLNLAKPEMEYSAFVKDMLAIEFTKRGIK